MHTQTCVQIASSKLTYQKELFTADFKWEEFWLWVDRWLTVLFGSRPLPGNNRGATPLLTQTPSETLHFTSEHQFHPHPKKKKKTFLLQVARYNSRIQLN